MNEEECRRPSSFEPQATNFGPSGHDRTLQVSMEEGDVFCFVGAKSFGSAIEVTKHATDRETYVDALNVQCAVYPYDPTHEAKQVARLRNAFEALVRTID